MPKSYLIFKWVVYTLATALLVLLQLFLLDRLPLAGIYPFLPPMIVGAAASFEGSKASPVFALVFGLLCDLTVPGPAAGFFTLIFPLAALVAALLAENLFSPGLGCTLMAVTVTYGFTAMGRLVLFLLHGHSGLPQLFLIAGAEFLYTLPWLIPVFLLYRRVHNRTTIDY